MAKLLSSRPSFKGLYSRIENFILQTIITNHSHRSFNTNLFNRVLNIIIDLRRNKIVN